MDTKEMQQNMVKHILSYVDSHLQEPITLKALADLVGYSPWYSARIFKEITGMAPFSYIRQRRLVEAARRLEGSKERIVDVAFDFVFDSHEGFTRAFSKQFGMTPQQFRMHRSRICVPAGHTGFQRQGEKQMKTVFVQVVDRPMRKVVLKYGKTATHYFSYCEEVGCEVWDQLSAIKEALYEPIGMWMPESLRSEGKSQYVQGVEVPIDYDAPLAEGFEIITLPACKMMVFQGPPFEDEEFEEAIQDVWETMKQYDPTLYGFAWADEAGPRFQLAPMGYRGYIEARPVIAVN